MFRFNLLSLVFIALFFFTTQEADAQRYKVPHFEARAGIGLLPTFLKDNAQTEVQPYSLELRYRLNKKYSFGLLAGQSISQVDREHHTGAQRRIRNNYKFFAVRAAIHTDPFEKWEIYGGPMLGYGLSDVSYTEVPDDKNENYFPEAKERSGLIFSGFVGTNYNIYQNVNLFGEISYGLSLATVGVAVRF